MKILCVTSNPKKIVSPARVLGGYGIEVVYADVREPEIVEIQAETAEEVATDKAMKAFRSVDLPLFCVDSAFAIPALDGFPGVFMKQVTRQIGAEGYVKLLMNDDGSGWKPRGCELVDALAYMDAGLKEPKLFVRRIPGFIAERPCGGEDGKHKSDLFRIFIPEGETVPLAAMTDAEYDRYRTSERLESFYHEFGRWLMSRAA